MKRLSLIATLGILILLLALAPVAQASATIGVGVWTESGSNPLFGGTTDGVNRAYYPVVIKVGTTYHIWYGDGTNTRHATSTFADFHDVTFPAPVITGMSETGYHPRVLYNPAGWDIGGSHYAGPFLLYSANVPWNKIHVAHSADGQAWTEIGLCTGVHSYGGNSTIYILDVLYEGGATWKAYADNGLGYVQYYTSANGIDWTGVAMDILGGSLQPWEASHNFSGEHVIKVGAYYVMFYGSGPTNNNQAIGMAMSTNGQTWVKSNGNPIFTITGAPAWRADRTYTPYVFQDSSDWKMYFTGRNAAGVYSVGYASNNGPFTLIQDAITAAVAGDTINVAAGTYNENVSITKNSITLIGAGAGANPALHTIIDSGAPANPANRGIQIAAGVSGVIIKDLRVQNFTSAGILFWGSNDHLTVDGVHVYNNTGGGGWGGLYINGPVSYVTINNVDARYNTSRGIVIWNGFKQHITITNSTAKNNNCCGIELQDGTASGVTITGNLIEDNADSGMACVGLKAGAGANLIANNTIRNNGRFGMELKLPDGNGLDSGDGSIVITGNLVERTLPIETTNPTEKRDLAGIAAFRRGWVSGNGNVDIPNGVVIKENTVNGYVQSNPTSLSEGFGIVVEGTNMKVLNNVVTASDVGIQVQQGHLPYTANTAVDGDQSDVADLYFGRGNSPTASAQIKYNRLSGNTVGLRNVAVPAANVSLTCNWWGDVSGPTAAANPGGLGQPLGGGGAFSPWLIYGTDASASAGFQLPTSLTVTPPGDVSAARNDYRVLGNAIGCVVSGQTINLSGAFDWRTTNAAASWALGNDGQTGSGFTIDDYEVDVPANVNNVTLTAASLGAATIQGPGDVPTVDLEGFLQFYNNGVNQNWTISNLRILDFDLSIGMFCCGGGPGNAYEGTTITNNYIRMATDLKGASSSGPENYQNIGIHLAYGKNQHITYNTIDVPGDGVSDPSTAGADWWTYGATPGWLYSSNVVLQSNTHGGDAYDGLLIDHNTIQVLNAQSANPAKILGIWENGHSHASDVTVSNNRFTNLATGNNPALNRQMALRGTSHSSASTSVVYSGNKVDGAGLGFHWLDVSAGLQPATLSSNTLSNAGRGLLLGGNGRATLTNNTIANTGSMAGVGTGLIVPATAAVTLNNSVGANMISGFATGIQNDGALTATNNSIINNVTGVLVQGTGTATLHQNSIAGNSTIGVNNTNTAAIVDATLNWWGDPSGCGPVGPGSGDRVSTFVNCSTFLTGTPTGVGAIGFSPKTCLVGVGQDTTVNVNMTADNLYGYQFKVNYTSAKVSASSIFVNTWFNTDGGFIPGGWNADCAGGACQFAVTKQAGSPVSGGGNVAALTLHGVAVGDVTLSLSDDILSNRDAEPLVHVVSTATCKVYGFATVNGTVKLQGRTTPITAGTVTLTDRSGTFAPVMVAFDATTGAFTAQVHYLETGTTYDIVAAHGLYLSNQYSGLLVNAATTYTLTPNPTKLLGGDANNSGNISLTDLSCIGSDFGVAPGTYCTAGDADINADTAVNILDLVLAGGNYGLASAQPW